jgi:proteasome accessory factor B
MRMFERDKDELRSLGIPIVTVQNDDGTPAAYRIDKADFYLPYLYIAAPPDKRTRPRRIDRYGYRALKELAFTADELNAVADAAARVRSLGESLLADDAMSAIRKLAVDLPIDGSSSGDVQFLSRERVDPATFERLSDALTRRKFVTFTYHTISRDSTETREVEPYGLFFVGSHWYLAARDRARDDIRNFRLTRMSEVEVNSARSQTADYEIPESFSLREHARSRQAWELGDGDTIVATVRFLTMSGPAAVASRLGDPVEGAPDLRTFPVRRIDAFVRWLMSFAGDAIPVAPASVIESYAKQVAETRAIYDGVEAA